jgi:hypothetical protein
MQRDYCLTVRLEGTTVVAETTGILDSLLTAVRQEFNTGHTASATLYDTDAHNPVLQ